MTYVPNKLLSRLVGFRLYSVQFGPDHLQLRFETDHSNHLPFLDCDVMPRVHHADGALHASDPGYADLLVSLISTEVVTTAEELGHGITLGFAGVSVVLRPRAGDLVGPEIATLGGFDDGASVVWRPGERSFADLDAE
ncbi:MAG: hypothetical protein JWQ74_126 [Marmoricola sp.]|nr:hypothetical protein [Marmoricola sp.]